MIVDFSVILILMILSSEGMKASAYLLFLRLLLFEEASLFLPELEDGYFFIGSLR